MSKLSKLILRDFMNLKANIRKKLPEPEKKENISRAPVVADASRALFWCSSVWLLLRLPVSPVSPGSPFRFRMPPAGPVFPKSDPGSRPRSTHRLVNGSEKTQIYKSPKKNYWFKSVFNSHQVFSVESHFCPVKRLALRRFQSRQHRTATSTQWWHLPAALPALQDYSSCRGIHHLHVGQSQGSSTVKVVLMSSGQNCSSNTHLLRFKSTMSSMITQIGTSRATHKSQNLGSCAYSTLSSHDTRGLLFWFLRPRHLNKSLLRNAPLLPKLLLLTAWQAWHKVHTGHTLCRVRINGTRQGAKLVKLHHFMLNFSNW